MELAPGTFSVPIRSHQIIIDTVMKLLSNPVALSSEIGACQVQTEYVNFIPVQNFERKI
jgi:hypothetical protein